MAEHISYYKIRRALRGQAARKKELLEAYVQAENMVTHHIIAFMADMSGEDRVLNDGRRQAEAERESIAQELMLCTKASK